MSEIARPRFLAVEAMTRGGSATRANDDAFGVGRHGAFVIDGATGLGQPLLKGESDAQWVAIEGATLLADAIDDAALSSEALIARTTRELRLRFERGWTRPPADTYEVPFASMMMARAAGAGIEVAWFGDCRTLVLDAAGSFHSVGVPPEIRAREAKRAREFSGGSAPKVREEALPQLRLYRNKVNGPDGYGLLGPDERANSMLRTRRIDLALPAHLLFFSDGFFALASDYRRYSDLGLIKTAMRVGLEPLYEELRDVEAADPTGTLFPRFKQSDDATAVLVRVEPA